MRQNGTFIVPVSVSINLESFFEYLTETLKDIVLDYLNIPLYWIIWTYPSINSEK